MADDDDNPTPKTRLEELRRHVCVGSGPVAVAVHDYPDPDALAGAFGMQHLLRHWGVESAIFHGGGLGRPENRVMAELVGMRLKEFRDCPDWSPFRGVVVVDTQPQSRNHSIPPELKVLAVVDHHILPPPGVIKTQGKSPLFDTVALDVPGPKDYYEDIRAEGGCTSSLMYQYLTAAGVVPSEHLATALFLGIQTDTDDLMRDAAALDRMYYSELLALADINVIRLVRRPLLSREFYALMLRALKRARWSGVALVTDCGEIPAPDQLSAISDLLIQSADAEWALALGRHEGTIYLSLRLRSAQAYGARLLRKVVEIEHGSAGGHRQAAGGEVRPVDGNLDRAARRLVRQFLELVDLGHEDDRPFLPEDDEQ